MEEWRMKWGSGGEVEGMGWVEESGGEVVMFWLLGPVCVQDEGPTLQLKGPIKYSK